MNSLLMLNKDWAPWLIVFAAFFACKVGDRIHASVGVLLWCILMGAFAWAPNSMNTETACIVLVYAAFFTCLNQHWEWRLTEILYGVCLLSIAVTLLQLGGPAHLRMGISGNASMNACLIAITLPIVLVRVKPLLLPPIFALALLAILSTKTSIAIGVLIITALVLLPLSVLTVAVAPILLLAGYLIDPTNFFSSNGRFDAWATIFNWWHDSGHLFFGLGTGAGTRVFNEQRQINADFSTMGVWAHNDYLQILFDNGVTGLLAVIAVFAYALIKSLNRPWLAASLLGYGATAFFNFPSHVPLHAFVGCSLVWLAHRGGKFHV